MNKREQKKMERKKAIIEIAKELFIDRGLQEVQMQEIAEASKIGIATLFRYFPKKEHLVLSVANSMVQEMDQDITKIIELPINAYEKMEKILDYYINITSDSRIKLIRFHQSFDIYASMVDYSLDSTAFYIETRESFAQTIMRVVEQGKVDGSLRLDTNLELVLMTIIHNISLFGIKVATMSPIEKIAASYEPIEQLQLLKTIFLSFIKA